MGSLETALRARREAGGKALVPYLTGGFPGVDAAMLRAVAEAGADAIEVGVPHSDPVMDGGVIQRSSSVALAAGTRPTDVLATIREAAIEIPVAVMTYVNPVLRRGIDGFLQDAVGAGVSGMIVPDLPVEEAEDFDAACAARGIDAVLLAAPGASRARLEEIGTRARGFVYCVATYGVTGARDELAGTARNLVEALRPLTDLPLLVGVGIGTPVQAAEAIGFADGVIVGSALMERLVADDREGMLALARSFRKAIPALGPASGSPRTPGQGLAASRQELEG